MKQLSFEFCSLITGSHMKGWIQFSYVQLATIIVAQDVVNGCA